MNYPRQDTPFPHPLASPPLSPTLTTISKPATQPLYPRKTPLSTPSSSRKSSTSPPGSSIQITDLTEEDAGYQSELDIDVLLPYETIEASSRSPTRSPHPAAPSANQSDVDFSSTDSDTHVARRMSRLQCSAEGDRGANDRLLAPELRHKRKATGWSTRGPKRSHSLAVDEGEEVDSDAWWDHGVGGMERRIRRRMGRFEDANAEGAWEGRWEGDARDEDEGMDRGRVRERQSHSERDGMDVDD
ncbi:hypothetical protein KVT40_002857 [Elsinoe batatas]|uniref:Uncharacterized protein n=1 Tax=Elsinoe batatas TaxID=2601811 RepID=A0A8K0L4T7_9PEZI|nr:hypothetical protein KVT40_002857 [Elsinoe batatas]